MFLASFTLRGGIIKIFSEKIEVEIGFVRMYCGLGQ